MSSTSHQQAGWLAARVVAALGLMVGFYALALAVAGGLLYLVYLDYAVAERVHPKLLLFCVIGAGSVLWAIVPRVDRFEPPGPRVMPAHEPELFRTLEQTANATGQTMPAEVYVVHDVNAFVTSRGGVMGFGSRRVMGLGLPLMQALTVEEFKGVLAHEFGHYSSGDVRLGPWIYKTRAAIGRTIERLSDNILQKIFVAYGNLFLRITHAISRRQEFVADEVAARVVGPGVMISGLRKVQGAALAFPGYWQSELAVVLAAGYLPPVIQGFSRFMQAPGVASGVRAAVTQAEQQEATNVFDTHPALRDRIAALSAFVPRSANGDDRPAAALLSNVTMWERRVLGSLAGNEWARDLKALDWEKVTDSVYVPMWRERVKNHGQLLSGSTIGTVPHTHADLVRLGSKIREGHETEVPEYECLARAWQLLAAAIALRLLDIGWTASTAPGEEVVLRHGADEFRPITELNPVVEKKSTIEGWRARCHALDIANVPLGSALTV